MTAAGPPGVGNLQAVLFDLDGTLLDTVADISLALNRALAEHSLPSLPVEETRTLIGRGAPALIARALARLGAPAAQVEPAALLARFHVQYQAIHEHGEIQARLYPGASDALTELHALRLRLAVVTNKPTQPTLDLLARTGLAQWIDAVVSGDGPDLKPHPQPLWSACERLGVAPAQALMVGDSMNDVLAARAAGVRIVCVTYGYNEGADPRTLPCDWFVESLAELPQQAIARYQVDGQQLF